MAGFGEGSGEVGKMGVIFGFVVFFLAYIITTIMIFIDMKARGAFYQGLIDEDLAKINAMGLDRKMTEWNAELAIRLTGKKEEAGADDQLITNALALGAEEF